MIYQPTCLLRGYEKWNDIWRSKNTYHYATISQQPSIDDIINGPIRNVFLKYAAHVALCLYLQHRHHTVGAGEAEGLDMGREILGKGFRFFLSNVLDLPVLRRSIF
jgi:hypothetical protein